MGYMKIPNLYKEQQILEFKNCYALEKIHGTSAHISWKKDKGIHFFSGGENHERFVALFSKEWQEQFIQWCESTGHLEITIYGEAYGGKQQGMSHTYGPDLKFIVFDVKIGNSWLDVPKAEKVTKTINLEFVDYEYISTDLEAVDAERDKPSTQAKRNGVGDDKIREGVVLRPPFEVTLNYGSRLITKHKHPKFQERVNQPKPKSPEQKQLLEEGQAIAEEWVTTMRLEHVVDKLRAEAINSGKEFVEDMTITGLVIKAMIDDIYTEAEGEIVESKEAKGAIGKLTAKLWSQRVQEIQK